MLNDISLKKQTKKRRTFKEIKECRSVYLGASDWELLDNIAEQKKYPGPTKVIRDMIQTMRANNLLEGSQ